MRRACCLFSHAGGLRARLTYTAAQGGNGITPTSLGVSRLSTNAYIFFCGLLMSQWCYTGAFFCGKGRRR